MFTPHNFHPNLPLAKNQPTPILFKNSPVPLLPTIQGIKEMLTFFSKTFSKRTAPGTRQSVQHESYIIHNYMLPSGLCGTAVCDLEYPPRVAFVMLTQLMEEYQLAVGDEVWKACTTQEGIAYPPLEEYLAKYQDPTEADKISKIQKDLDATTEILHKTIDSVLERGVKLDSLVERSDDLSRQSKMFYKQAKKTNSCCVIS